VSPIDRHLTDALLGGAAQAAKKTSADALTANFTNVLAETIGWRESELPVIYSQLAHQGLLTKQGTRTRTFGELVFAEFAELTNDPTKYPEANAAFLQAQGAMLHELVSKTLEVVRGLDDGLDRLADKLANAQWDSLQELRTEGQRLVAALQGFNLDKLATRDQVDELPGRLMDLIRVETIKRHAPISDEAVIELARRLKPESQLDARQAFEEIRYVVHAYCDAIVRGERPSGSDGSQHELLQRVAALTRAFRFEDAAQLIDSRLEELDRRDAAQRQALAEQRAVLLASKLEQCVLMHNADGAAAVVLSLGALENPDRPAWAQICLVKLEAIAQKRGSPKSRLALEIALQLAQARVESARNSYESGMSHGWTAYCLLELGQRDGRTTRLEYAVAGFREALRLVHRADHPLQWAALQNDLGNALERLGERSKETMFLNEALAAYEHALTERSRDKVPGEWVETKTGLGVTLWALGRRERSTERLQQAVQAFREAQQELDREAAPVQWSVVQLNLRNVLLEISLREGGDTHLRQAVNAFRQALEALHRQAAPFEWATTQNSLSCALRSLGEHEQRRELLDQAERAALLALEEVHRDWAPRDWAGIQHNLANVYYSLGANSGDTQLLERAVATYRIALEERKRQGAPLDWAATQNGLGHALYRIGRQLDDPARLKEAESAQRLALEEYTPDVAPLQWANIQCDLGDVLQDLGELVQSPEQVAEAIHRYQSALEQRMRAQFPLEWGRIQSKLGYALKKLSTMPGRDRLPSEFRFSAVVLLMSALRAFDSALEECTREQAPRDWATAQSRRGVTLEKLGEVTGGVHFLYQAEAAFGLALTVRTREVDAMQWASTQDDLGCLLLRISQQDLARKERLEQAVAAFTAALDVFTPERVPSRWAATQNNLGYALKFLGETEQSIPRLEESERSLLGAMAVFNQLGLEASLASATAELRYVQSLLLQYRGNTGAVS
jgi:tetratricopeptide (TPR) repeat protein